MVLQIYRVLQTHQAESSKMEYRSTVPYSGRFGKMVIIKKIK